MHFDQRTQRALREIGLETDEIAAVSDRVAELVSSPISRSARWVRWSKCIPRVRVPRFQLCRLR